MIDKLDNKIFRLKYMNKKYDPKDYENLTIINKNVLFLLKLGFCGFILFFILFYFSYSENQNKIINDCVVDYCDTIEVHDTLVVHDTINKIIYKEREPIQDTSDKTIENI